MHENQSNVVTWKLCFHFQFSFHEILFFSLYNKSQLCHLKEWPSGFFYYLFLSFFFYSFSLMTDPRYFVLTLPGFNFHVSFRKIIIIITKEHRPRDYLIENKWVVILIWFFNHLFIYYYCFQNQINIDKATLGSINVYDFLISKT